MTALSVIGELGAAGRQFLPQVEAAFDGDDPLTQVWAAWCLWKVDGRAEIARAALIESIDSPNVDVQYWAIRHIVDMNALMPTVQNKIRMHLESNNQAVREAAMSALQSAGGVEPEESNR